MTKRQIQSAINKAVYIYAESLGYQMSDDNDGSFVTFYKADRPGKDAIDYHRSYQECVTLNWASDESKADCALIAEFVKQEKAKYQ
jgi:hypothetical protein